MEEAGKNSLDPWVFHGIVWTESRWTAHVVRREQDGSCSVGLGQINVRCDSKQVKVLQDPRENLKKMGVFLGNLQTSCKKNCSGLGWLKAYNWNDKAYVPQKVEPIVQRCHASYSVQSHLRAVQADLYLPWLPRETAD
jgi:hypothetical protein